MTEREPGVDGQAEAADQLQSEVTPDRPLDDPEMDELGYAPFAENIAAGLSEADAARGLVAGIYGRWGSGKTTALNFVQHFLQSSSTTEPPLVLHFNPWWFSSASDLVSRFFAELESVLESTWGKRSEALRLRLARLASLIARVPGLSTAAGIAEEVIRPATKTLHEAKAEVAELLGESSRRVFVLIDDVDRLDRDEVRMVFKVVRAVADFPNVLYLLAFDSDVVARTLELTHGAEFIEKIVEVPFDLPLPDRVGLRKMLTNRLDRLEPPSEHFDQGRWGNIVVNGLDHLVETPRDVVRLANTLSVTYPPIKGEVNAVDFIALESLRVFARPAYEVIRRNQELFAGWIGAMERAEQITAFHEMWIATINADVQEPVKAIVRELFPKAGRAFGGNTFGSDWAPAWRRELRAASPDLIATYFRFSVPEGTLGVHVVKVALGVVGVELQGEPTPLLAQGWRFHIAPAVMLERRGATQLWVIDPVVFPEGPALIHTWANEVDPSDVAVFRILPRDVYTYDVESGTATIELDASSMRIVGCLFNP